MPTFSLRFRSTLLLAATALALAACGRKQPPIIIPTPTPAPTASATPADTHFQPAKLLKHPTPAYPVLALLNRVEGVVKARFAIDDQGHVSSVKAIKSAGSVLIDSVVLDQTLHEWTFRPAMLDGKPISSSYEQEFEFRLDPEEQRQFARERLAAPIGLPDPPYPPAALPSHTQGSCTVGVIWTPAGLVDLIYLTKHSGSVVLDHAALRWAFTHWHIDPKDIHYDKDKDGKDLPFTKTVTFTPPAGAASPTPAASASAQP